MFNAIAVYLILASSALALFVWLRPDLILQRRKDRTYARGARFGIRKALACVHRLSRPCAKGNSLRQMEHEQLKSKVESATRAFSQGHYELAASLAREANDAVDELERNLASDYRRAGGKK